MPFRDEYTDFTFNGITSRQMKVWITNSRDIQFRLTPEFTDTFVSPAFSNSQILTGTNITKSTFQLKCIAIDISMNEWRAIQQWLSPEVIGRLEFDFNYNTYYNAKVNKSITGTTFVKGGYDRLFGDLYVVEFTIDFTTVDDYAALGPVNVGCFNITIPTDNTTNSSTTTTDSTTTDSTADSSTTASNNYKINNVLATSNNPYYIPMFTEGVSSDFKNLGGKTIRFKIKEESGTGLENGTTVAYFIRPGDYQKQEETNYNYHYEAKIDSVPSADVDFYTIKIVGSLDGGDNLGKDYLSIKLNQGADGEYWSDELTLFSEDIFYRIPESKFFIEANIQQNYYNICNTGSYDLYPDFYIRPNNSAFFNINYNYQDHYRYTYELNSTSYVNIDGRHGLVLSGNILAEEVYIYKKDANTNTEQRKAMFGAAGRINQGILSIPPGKAESLKCFVLSIENVILLKGDTSKDLKLIHLVTNQPLQFSHNHTIMHLFADVKYNQAFNSGIYPQTPKVSENIPYLHSFEDNHLLKESAIYCDSDKYHYTIIGPSTELGDIEEEKNYYLSICDPSVLKIEGQGFIYLQSRGAF